MNAKCIYTCVELPDGTMKEHILQNFTGATWVSDKISCNEVQNKFGHGCDVALEKNFRFIRNILGASGNRSTSMQGCELRSEDGHRYLLKNGDYELIDPIVGEFEDVDSKTKRVKVCVGNKHKIGWAESLVRKNMPQGFSRIEATQVSKVEHDLSNDGFLSTSITYGGAGCLKGILKSCFNLLGATNHEVAALNIFDPLRRCLVDEELDDINTISNFCRNVTDDRYVELQKRGEFDHVLCVYSSGDGIYGYARLYGQFDFSMHLCDGFDGKPIQEGYCVDPFGEHGLFERKYNYAISALPLFERQEAVITNASFTSLTHAFERFLNASLGRQVVGEVVQRVMERHSNDLYLNYQQMTEECMKELKQIKATL